MSCSGRGICVLEQCKDREMDVKAEMYVHNPVNREMGTDRVRVEGFLEEEAMGPRVLLEETSAH